MLLSSQVKEHKNGRSTGIHSEHRKGITEQLHLRKDPKEEMNPRSPIKGFTLL